MKKKNMPILIGCFLLISISICLGTYLQPYCQSKTLRFGHNLPEGTPQHQAALYFKQLVERASSGLLKIEVVPNQALGTDAEMTAMVQRGELAFALPPTSKISLLVPKASILDIPFLFSNAEQAYQALDGSFGKDIFESLGHIDITPLAVWDAGFKNFTANKRISQPTDFSGLRIRVMRNETLIEQALSLEAFPSHHDFHNIRQKLSLKEIDSQENSIGTIYSMNIHKEQSHLIESRHGFLGQVMIVSTKLLDQLAQEHQKIILDAAKVATSYQRSLVNQFELESIEKMKNEGLNISPFSDEHENKFLEAFSGIYHNNRNILKTYSPFINKKIIPYLKEKVVIGMNINYSYHALDSALAIRRGLGLAIDEINEAGGLHGLPVILASKNHGGFPTKGLNNMEIFAKDPSVIAVMGGVQSPVVLAEKDLVNHYRLPYLIPWAAASSIIDPSNPYLFRYSIRDEYAGGKLVDQAAKRGNSVSLILEKTKWGKSNEKSIIAAINRTSEITLDEMYWFEWGETDFSEILESITREKSKTIIFVGNDREGLALIQSLSKKQISIPLVSHWGITGGRLWEEGKKEISQLDLSFIQTFSLTNNKTNQAVESLVSRYLRKYSLPANSRLPASSGTIHAYELVKMLATAIRKSNSLDRTLVAKNLVSLQRHDGLFEAFIKPFKQNQFYEREALGPKHLTFGQFDQKGNIVLDRKYPEAK